MSRIAVPTPFGWPGALAACAVLALAACVAPAAAPPTPTVGAPAVGAPTQDAATRAAPVVPGRRARVFIFAGLGPKCEALAAPQVSVTRAPGKGEISFEPGQQTLLNTATNPACVGKSATGTGVYYTARAGTEGTDRFVVEARMASGETMTRTFEVRIEP